MLLITNKQTEPVRIVYKGESFIIQAGCSDFISDIKKATITIEHFNFFNYPNTKTEKIIGAVAKSSILIVDSTLHFDEINQNATMIVRNGVYEYSTGDFGYLYFDISTENCRATLNSCKVVNCQEVLHMQKLIRMGEAYDFPPFSIVSALLKYNKIKKMCSQENVFNYLLQNTTIMRSNTQK